jgi:hypothetical protein
MGEQRLDWRDAVQLLHHLGAHSGRRLRYHERRGLEAGHGRAGSLPFP